MHSRVSSAAVAGLSSLLLCVSAFAAVPPWVKAAIPAAMPESVKSAKAVVLLDERVMTVAAAGEITTRHRQVIRIQASSARDYGFAAVYFDNDTRLKFFRGWSIDAKGSEYEIREREAVETQPFDGELYSDSRMKVMQIPAAEPGSVVAWEYEQRERPYLLQALWDFQREIPVLTARLQIVMPQGWSQETRWSNYKAVEPANGIWELRDIPAIADEPRMPSAASLAGRAGILFVAPQTRTLRGWNDVADWFGSLAATRVAVTPDIQSKVKELAKDGANADSIRALARFAQRDVRYVAIEVGIGGYQPHAAGDVFRNRYGDCKDKATLLKTMLKEIGVESYYVLVHTTRGVVDPELPALASFNHVVLAIPAPGKEFTVEHAKLGKLLIFDPTSTTTPFGLVPSYLQDSRGLLVTPQGGELIAIAPHPAEANQLRRKATLKLDDAGTLSGAIEEVRTGRIAAEMRYSLQPLSATERVRFVESMLSAHLNNHSASGIAIENLDDTDKDLVVRYQITAKDYARKVADMRLIRPRVLGQKSEAIVDVKERKYGYVTEGPSVQTDDVEIAVAPALKVDELPMPVSMETPAVQYSSQIEFKDGVLRYKRKYALQTYFVPREGLADLNKAFSKILADERASAVFK
jgi:transglutaminase-like putative cysteine protease